MSLWRIKNALKAISKAVESAIKRLEKYDEQTSKSTSKVNVGGVKKPTKKQSKLEAKIQENKVLWEKLNLFTQEITEVTTNFYCVREWTSAVSLRAFSTL